MEISIECLLIPNWKVTRDIDKSTLQVTRTTLTPEINDIIEKEKTKSTGKRVCHNDREQSNPIRPLILLVTKGP